MSINVPQVNNITIHWDKLDNKDNGESLVSRVWDGLLKFLFIKFPAVRIWMLNSQWELNKDSLNIYLERNGIEFLRKRKVHSVIEEYFKRLGYPLRVILKEKAEQETYDIREEEREIIKSILKENEVENFKNDFEISSNIIGKIITRDPEPIGVSIEETNEIIFSGEVFNVEKRELKSKTTMLTFGITDYTGSITVKIFLSGEQKSLEHRFKEGLWLRIRGKIEKSRYSQEYELIPFDVNIDKKPERQDNHPEKRVELHLHTRYSSMDALCSPTEILNMAKKWGHKAVAFTDHGVIQSFPEVYEASRKIGIKPIYGLEAYIFDDEHPVMISPPDKPIKDVTFVVMDIETTGLCFDGDEIIEIGAVKILNNDVIDRFSSFVKPSKSIPANIINLTGITNEMLRTAQPIELVLPSFIEFLGDGVFVAHNAEFDSGFIRREADRLGIPFENKVLDTLALARIVFSELKNHRLKTLAKKLNIRMGSHHRAVDDANTTALILKELLIKIYEAGINNLSEINEIYKLKKGVTNLSSYHATILVKNSEGLSNLYKLVSLAHLNYFYRHPRIPKSLLKTYSEGLIIGTGCQAGELFQNLLHFSSCEKIESILGLYNFLEIQPLHNNAFLVDGEFVSNRQRLEELNREIYNLGRDYKKPVVMTGDFTFCKSTG